MNTTTEHHLRFARIFAKALDTQFSIGSFKFGLGPIIGLIPGFGDVVESALSFYLVWIGLQMKLPTEKIAQMIGNIAINFFMTLFPFVGDIGDFIFKSNIRNLHILEEHAKRVVIDGEIIENTSREIL